MRTVLIRQALQNGTDWTTYGYDCTDIFMPTDTTWHGDMFTYANGYDMTGGHVYLRQRIQHDMTGGHVCLRQRTQHDYGTCLQRQRLQHDNGTCLLRRQLQHDMTGGHVCLRQRKQRDRRTCFLRQRLQHNNGTCLLRQRLQHDNGTCLLRQRLHHDNGTCLLRQRLQHDNGTCLLRQRIQHDTRTCLPTPTNASWQGDMFYLTHHVYIRQQIQHMFTGDMFTGTYVYLRQRTQNGRGDIFTHVNGYVRHDSLFLSGFFP